MCFNTCNGRSWKIHLIICKSAILLLMGWKEGWMDRRKEDILYFLLLFFKKDEHLRFLDKFVSPLPLHLWMKDVNSILILSINSCTLLKWHDREPFTCHFYSEAYCINHIWATLPKLPISGLIFSCLDNLHFNTYLSGYKLCWISLELSSIRRYVRLECCLKLICILPILNK